MKKPDPEITTPAPVAPDPGITRAIYVPENENTWMHRPEGEPDPSLPKVDAPASTVVEEVPPTLSTATQGATALTTDEMQGEGGGETEPEPKKEGEGLV